MLLNILFIDINMFIIYFLPLTLLSTAIKNDMAICIHSRTTVTLQNLRSDSVIPSTQATELDLFKPNAGRSTSSVWDWALKENLVKYTSPITLITDNTIIVREIIPLTTRDILFLYKKRIYNNFLSKNVASKLEDAVYTWKNLY
jgi:hypothetical protein